MPRNDRSDSLSVRGEDDPRRPLKGMQQETELELGQAEAGQTGGVEHQSLGDREGIDRRERPVEEATRQVTAASEGQHPLPRRGSPGGETATSSAERERGEGPRIKDGE